MCFSCLVSGLTSGLGVVMVVVLNVVVVVVVDLVVAALMVVAAHMVVTGSADQYRKATVCISAT